MTLCPGGCGNQAHEDGDMCRDCLLGARTLNRLRIEQLSEELEELKKDHTNLNFEMDEAHDILWTTARRGNIAELAKQVMAELDEVVKQRDEALSTIKALTEADKAIKDFDTLLDKKSRPEN